MATQQLKSWGGAGQDAGSPPACPADAVSMPEAPVAVTDGSTDPGASARWKRRREAGRPVLRWSWRAVSVRPLRAGHGIWLEPAGPVPGAVRGSRVAGPLLALTVAAFAAAQYAIGRPVTPEAWLAIAPLLGSLALGPPPTPPLPGSPRLLGLGLALETSGPAGRLASSLAVLALLAGFAVVNAVLRAA